MRARATQVRHADTDIGMTAPVATETTPSRFSDPMAKPGLGGQGGDLSTFPGEEFALS